MEGVHVAEGDRAVVVRRDEVGGVVDRFELEELEHRVAQGDPACVVEVVQEAMGREDAQARILQGDEAGEREAARRRPSAAPTSSA